MLPDSIQGEEGKALKAETMTELEEAALEEVTGGGTDFGHGWIDTDPGDHPPR